MKKLSLISGSLTALLTISLVSACNNDKTITTPEQINEVNAQSVKKNREPKNLIKVQVKGKFFSLFFIDLRREIYIIFK